MTKVVWQRIFKLICPMCNAVAAPIKKEGPVTIYRNTCPKCGSTMEEVISDEEYEEEDSGELVFGDTEITLPTKAYEDKAGASYRVIRNPYNQFTIRKRIPEVDGWRSDYKFPQTYPEYADAQIALDEMALIKGWRVI